MTSDDENESTSRRTPYATAAEAGSGSSLCVDGALLLVKYTEKGKAGYEDW